MMTSQFCKCVLGDSSEQQLPPTPRSTQRGELAGGRSLVIILHILGPAGVRWPTLSPVLGTILLPSKQVISIARCLWSPGEGVR